jgi:hypothetical protein
MNGTAGSSIRLSLSLVVFRCLSLSFVVLEVCVLEVCGVLGCSKALCAGWVRGGKYYRMFILVKMSLSDISS